MNILIIGNGAREHALVWKVAQSPHVHRIFVANGNAGTAQEPKTENIRIEPTAIDDLLDFAVRHTIDLTIVGPEAPMALGIADRFSAAKLPCFAPSQNSAQLESSKVFSKTFMQQHRIPTAQFATFSNVERALSYMRTQPFPQVIKADGLAAGKGVIIAMDEYAATKAITDMLSGHAFGAASHNIVIENFLAGEELSFIALVSGDTILPLASSQDHKRRDDGDRGPNTGGMGAYSPAPLLTPDLEKKIMQRIMHPTIAGLKAMGMPYLGFLYAGLMISPAGDPIVLEFNCRLGDPETQPILFRLQNDLVELCLAAIENRLDQCTITWDPRPALTIVLASGGYPDAYDIGHIIQGLDIPLHPDCKIFHAGTQLVNHHVTTNGGRVLSVTAKADTLQQAHTLAYQIADHIHWPNRFFRHDIAHRALSSSHGNKTNY